MMQSAAFLTIAVALSGAIGACSASSTDNSSASSPSSACAAPGGPVSGPMDTHCTGDAGAIAQVTRAASCSIDAGADDAGAGGGGAGAGYGATMDNTQGDDDDCKYHLSWTASPICEGGGVMFTLVLTNKVDNSPAVGAPIRAEVVLHDTHPAPDTQKTAVEGPPGTYLVGPIKFDAPGQWTVRFHIHEECADLRADSPHGHAAFLVNVP